VLISFSFRINLIKVILILSIKVSIIGRMNQQATTATPGTAIYSRLIALWVICEVMLGGIIHGFRIPVSGLVVGGCAVVCICLIAYYVPAKGAIIKATIIVAIFKMMLSPQSPPPAYMAVFFQGLMGELLFWNRKFFRLSCLALGILALVESGLQRILVLTIVYGNDLWKAINDFMNGVIKQPVNTNYSFYIAGVYVLLHAIAGIIIGLWAGAIPTKSRQWSVAHPGLILVIDHTIPPSQPHLKRRRRIRKGLLIIWIALILLYAQSYFKIGSPLLPSSVSLRIFIRSVIIVLTWYFLLSPSLSYLLKNWLQKKQVKSQQDIQQILQLLPFTRQLVVQSWQLASTKKGMSRVIQCCKIVLLNALHKPDA
jgi:ABC-type thiamin/hydroxymethylpyrimidine transport system permease subunit